MKRDSGVYGIFNTSNGKVYVGSAAKSLRKRKMRHFWELGRGVHGNRYLQRAYDKYGVDCFEFRVLERCSPDKVLEVEQRWIDRLDSANRKIGYNLSPTAGSNLGVRRTKESRAKAAASRRRWEKENPEAKARMLAALYSPSAKAKHAEAMRRYGKSESHKELVEKNFRSKESRQKTAAALRGRKRSSETRAKISAATKGKTVKWTPEALAKRSATNKGSKRSAETRARMAAAQKAAWVRRKHS